MNQLDELRASMRRIEDYTKIPDEELARFSKTIRAAYHCTTLDGSVDLRTYLAALRVLHAVETLQLNLRHWGETDAAGRD
jgi:hypothetical protein